MRFLGLRGGGKLPPPNKPRELFELFARYRAEQGIEGLLDSVDWSGALPHQIYGAFLARLPESIRMAQPGALYSGRDHAIDAMNSREFQHGMVELLLNAYADKRRLIHIHIHKTAGTDLRHILAKRYPWLHESHIDLRQVDRPELYLHLRQFVRRAAKNDSVLLTGHIDLKWYVDREICRFRDRIFTVVRNPRDIVVSYVNYVLRRFSENPSCSAPDTFDWRQVMGIEEIPRVMTQSDRRAIAVKILRTPQVILRNFQASRLGDGTADSAFEMMARTNIELTDVQRYARWLRDTWRIESRTHENRSPKFVIYEDFDATHRDYIDEICVEDCKLYESVQKGLSKTDDCRVFGAMLD